MSRRVVLGHVDAVPPGEGRNFVVDGLTLAVFRTRAGGVFATQARCPHKSGPLIDGLVGADSVICPLHEWRFDLRTGESPNGACLETYSIEQDATGVLSVVLP